MNPIFAIKAEKSPGIYAIMNVETGVVYVGSSKNVVRRIKSHLYELKLNKHNNPYLQHAFNKYGESKFLFYCVRHADQDQLSAIEQLYINYLIQYDIPRYNIATIAGRPSCSPETYARRSEKIVGKYRGENHWHYGRKRDESVCKRISECNKGMVAWNKGITLSSEHIGKRLRTKRKQNPYSGTYYIKKRDKYIASINYKSKNIYIGEYDTREEAAQAYASKVKEIYGIDI